MVSTSSGREPRHGAWVATAAVAVAALIDALAVGLAWRGLYAAASGVHVVAATVFALGLPALPGLDVRPAKLGRILLFTLAFILPVIGPLGAGGGIAWAVTGRRPNHDERLVVWPRLDLPAQPPPPTVDASSRFPDGSVAAALQNFDELEARVRAVLALRRLPAVAAVPLLRIALKDPADDVRLLAYAQLDSLDKAINDRIQRRLGELDAAPTDAKAPILQAVAQDYWDLAHLGLATADVEAHVLEEASRHVKRALDLAPDGAAALLLGRIRLRQRRPHAADAALSRAEDLGLTAEAVAPYRAEAAFQRGAYDEVRARLASLPASARSTPPLAGVLQFWLDEQRGSAS